MLTFETATHEYRWDGRVVPSVTEIIGDSGCIPRFAGGEWYRQRGTAFHLAAALHDQGVLDEETVDPEIAAHLDGYRAFLDAVGEDLVIGEIEQPRFSEIHGYAGTPDRVIRWRGKLGVLDLKTGGKAAWHQLQTAGYCGLVEGATARLVVNVQEDGCWALTTHTDRHDWTAFTSATALWLWRARHGALGTAEAR